MPMTTYLCPEGHTTEHFYHSAPATIACDVCGVDSTPDPHPHLTRPASTGFAVPIVIDINTSTGQPYFPASVSDEVSPGCVRQEIHSMREYESFRRKMDSLETAATHSRARAELEHLSSQTKERREAIDTEMRRRGLTSSRMRDIARELLDRKREARFVKVLSRGSNFHNRALEFDSKAKQRIVDYER